jgi:hypothetical protein
MTSRGFLCCLLLAPFPATPQDLPPGVLLVARIKAHVKEQVAHMPQYTCLETFERFRKLAGPKAKPTPQDTVRLEVLFTGRKEFFDSPGGRDFKEEDPVAFIGGGLIGNGMFAGDLQTLFVSDQGLFTYRGEERLAGRPSARFDFRVPILNSGYVLATPSGRALVAWKGTFWADPVSLDLIRLEVRADEIPPLLEITDAITTVEYARTRIGREDVPLPQTGELRLLGTAGDEALDRFEFTHCRSFQTETSISYAEPAAMPQPPKAAQGAPNHADPPVARALPFPAGLTVTIALDAAVTDLAAVGEMIDGHVAGNVIFRGKTVIPDGATVRGRIRRLEHYADMGGYFTLGFEFTDIEAGGLSTRFFANLETAAPLAGFESSMSNGSSRTLDTRSSTASIGTFERIGGLVTQFDRKVVSVPALPGVGTFFMRGAHFEIPKGWKMVWKTQALN